MSIYVAYYRPLHTQAAALKLDLNDFNMCLSMSPITRTLNFLKRLATQRLSTQLNTQARSTLKIGTEHSGSQHSSTHRQALNTAALNSEDRHRPLHTQAAALKLDLNGFKKCLSMSPYVAYLQRQTLGTDPFRDLLYAQINTSRKGRCLLY